MTQNSGKKDESMKADIDYDEIFRPVPKRTWATESQLAYIGVLADDIPWLCKLFGVRLIDELTVAQASDAIDLLKADRG